MTYSSSQCMLVLYMYLLTDTLLVLSMSPLCSVKSKRIRFFVKNSSQGGSELLEAQWSGIQRAACGAGGFRGREYTGGQGTAKIKEDEQSFVKALNWVWLEVREGGMRAGRQADSQWERRSCQSLGLEFVPLFLRKREITNYCTLSLTSTSVSWHTRYKQIHSNKSIFIFYMKQGQ